MPLSQSCCPLPSLVTSQLSLKTQLRVTSSRKPSLSIPHNLSHSTRVTGLSLSLFSVVSLPSCDREPSVSPGPCGGPTDSRCSGHDWQLSFFLFSFKLLLHRSWCFTGGTGSRLVHFTGRETETRKMKGVGTNSFPACSLSPAPVSEQGDSSPGHTPSCCGTLHGHSVGGGGHSLHRGHGLLGCSAQTESFQRE